MHVVEQLASAVFVDDFSGTVEGIDEVPVPVMDVGSDVFAEVRDAMLIVQIWRGEVLGDLDGGLVLTDVALNSIKVCLTYPWTFWDEVGLFASSRENLAVDVFVWKDVDERGQVEIASILTMQQGDRKCVVEEVRIDAVSGVHSNG